MRSASMPAPEPFPWPEVMRFGFGILKLPPAAFWSMTIRELQHAMRAHGPAAGQPMSRTEFEHLARSYPDGNKL